MSRIGKIPVAVPKEAKVTINKSKVLIEGVKGKLNLDLSHGISVKEENAALVVMREANTKQMMADHGTTRALLKNMLAGVTVGHKRNLEIQGVGFRVALQGKILSLNLGFSNPITFEIPVDVNVVVVNQTQISLEGIDNIKVGQVAAQIRAIKPAEPYKGKGIRYLGEVVRRKKGKSGKK